MKLHFFSDYSIIIRSMKKVKAILPTFFHSLVPQDIYYPKLLHTRLTFSLKYYSIVLLLFAFIFSVLIFFMYSPHTITSYKDAVTQSLITFPEGVIIRITDGVLEINQNKPFFLWIYRNEKPLFVFMAHTKDHLTVANTPLPIMYLGKDRMQFSFKGTTFVKPYDKSTQYLITKDTLQSFVRFTHSFFPPLLFFFTLFLFIVLPIAFGFWATLSIIVNAALVFILLRAFIPHIHFKKCIQAGMHGTHIPLITTIILFTLFPTSPNVLILSSSLMFVFSLVAVYEMYSKSLTHSKGR